MTKRAERRKAVLEADHPAGHEPIVTAPLTASPPEAPAAPVVVAAVVAAESVPPGVDRVLPAIGGEPRPTVGLTVLTTLRGNLVTVDKTTTTKAERERIIAQD